MKRSLCLSMAAGVAATVGSVHAQQTMYYNAGRPDTMLNGTAVNFVGFISGTNTGTPQRWSAMAFTIGAGGANIGEIDAEGFITPGNDPASVAYIIWNRSAGDPAPVAADQLFTGSVPLPVPTADPRIAGTDQGTYQFVLPSVVHLNPGNYWLTLYGDAPSASNTSGIYYFAWFGNCQPDPVYYASIGQPTNTPIYHADATSAFMWRSSTFPAGGFQVYRPTTLAVDPAPTSGPSPQDPNYMWNCSFTLLSAPPSGACCLPAGNCQVMPSATCGTQGGVYQGDGVVCGTCPQPGACCSADGTCAITSASQCVGASQVYRGNGTTCASANCSAPGACCTLDGTCSQLSEPACRGANGVFGGIGVACGAANCPTSYNYLGNSVPIPDAVNGTTCGAEAYAEITVADSFTLGSADASLFITHTYQGDVKVWLEHTNTNHRVQIINQPPAGAGTYGTGITPNQDNYGSSTVSTGLMRLIDSASSRYITPPAPAAGIPGVTGEWQPENPLAAFAGENSAGTWRLVAQDCGPADLGNIEYWVLSLRRPGVTCYPNCDHSTALPFLNVADFSCFLSKYAAGDAYANCDGSTQQPVLNVQDFSCFLTKYAAGCSAP